MAGQKSGSEILAFVYRKTELPDRDQKAKRLHLCGKTLIFAEKDGGLIPAGAYRCGIRLCPSCSWIRSRQVFENVYSVITDPEFSGKQFIFLTLTVKNCRGEFLESEINRLLSAWRDLTKDERKPFRESFLGTFRALEVTYNRQKKSYHPHLHAMAAVEPGYFRKTNPDYISQAKLRELWRDACGLDYLPQCRIEKVKNTAKKQVAEVAKYTVKSAEYISRPEVVQVLDPALRNKRLIAYGGIFKTVKQRLNLPDDDFPEGEFRVSFEELLRNPCIRKWILEWHGGTYHVSVIEPLPPEQLIQSARRLSGEIIDGYFGGQGGA